VLLVLDEVANICRIADLPQQYSHLGSRSIVPVAIGCGSSGVTGAEGGMIG